MKNHYLICTFLLFFFKVNAQSNFQIGRIITKSGDTLQGFVNEREWDVNPSSIEFSRTGDGKSKQTYKPNDVRFVQVNGVDFYESAFVAVSQSRVAPIEQLSIGADIKAEKAQVFLKLISTGDKLNLYSFTDENKNRFYVKETNSDTIIELLNLRYLHQNDNRKIVSDERYKSQFVVLVNHNKAINTSSLVSLLSKTQYTQKDISKIVAYFNGSSNAIVHSKKQRSSAFYIGSGATMSMAKYNGRNELAEGATQKISILPFVSAGMDLFINPSVRKTIVRFDITLSPSKLKVTKAIGVGKDGHVTHVFDRYCLSFSPMIMFNMFNTQKMKFYVATGLSGTVSFYANNSYTMSYSTGVGPGNNYDLTINTKLEPFGLAVPLRVGAQLNRRFELYTQYNIPVTPVTAYNFYSIRVLSGQLGINYKL